MSYVNGSILQTLDLSKCIQQYFCASNATMCSWDTNKSLHLMHKSTVGYISLLVQMFLDVLSLLMSLWLDLLNLFFWLQCRCKLPSMSFWLWIHVIWNYYGRFVSIDTLCADYVATGIVQILGQLVVLNVEGSSMVVFSTPSYGIWAVGTDG